MGHAQIQIQHDYQQQLTEQPASTSHIHPIHPRYRGTVTNLPDLDRPLQTFNVDKSKVVEWAKNILIVHPTANIEIYERYEILIGTVTSPPKLAVLPSPSPSTAVTSTSTTIPAAAEKQD